MHHTCGPINKTNSEKAFKSSLFDVFIYGFNAVISPQFDCFEDIRRGYGDQDLSYPNSWNDEGNRNRTWLQDFERQRTVIIIKQISLILGNYQTSLV